MNRTIKRTYDILNYISRADEKGVSLAEVAQQFDMPKSSTFDILQSLLELKAIQLSKYNDKRYILGISCYTLGMRYYTNKNLVGTCGPYLKELADELHRTAFVGILDGLDIVYVYKYTGNNAKLATCTIGTRHPVYTTSLGKAILAFLEKDKQKELVDKINFVKMTQNTISTKEKLISCLDQFKKQGYSIDDKENEVMMICYGAPIFDYSGKVIAAISLSDIKNPDYTDEEIGIKLRTAALRISQELGYTGTFWEE